MPGPLEGFKIVEFAEWVAAPCACAILSDWGADVVKIEPPHGDALRGLRSIQDVKVDDVHVWFENANRNKRSMSLDMRRPGALAVIAKLVADADVFITNYRRPALERLGTTYARLKDINPKIVYVSLTGFGHQGAESEKPGYDFAGFWARAGFMSKLGETLPHPPAMRTGQGDCTTSMMIAGAISAALLSRERTGKGQEVELSLYHTGVWVLGMEVETRLSLGVEIHTQPRHLSPTPLWNMYQAKDGPWLQLAMLQPDRYWSRFCAAMGRPELEHDARFAAMDAREQNSTTLFSLVEGIIAEKTAAEWEEIMTRHELIFQKANTISDVVEDPQAWENGFFEKVEHPVKGEIALVASPAKFLGTPASIRSCAPQIGQHTEEVLLEAGYQWSEIEGLREDGIIS